MEVLKTAGERLFMLSIDGAHHFAWNNIFAYLTLNDVVHILAIFSQSSFVPTRAHLEDTVRRALRLSLNDQRLSHRETIIPFHPDVTMPTLSFGRTNNATDDIVSEIAITSDTLRSIYLLVKNHVIRDCVPTPYMSSLPVNEVVAPVTAASAAISSIVLNGNLCMFRRHTTAARQSVEVAFLACSCHTNECNRIVLWDCHVCENPCTECGDHAAMCQVCDKQACRNCFLDKNDIDGIDDDDAEFCKGCCFSCVSCRFPIRKEQGMQPPFCCQGQSAVKNSTPCPFGKGLGSICWECEDNGAAGGRRCCECKRMACDQCNIMRGCDSCGVSSCIFCDVFSKCATCNLLLCNNCVMNGGIDIFTCKVCNVPYCTECKDMWFCGSCCCDICCSCSPPMYCESCEEAFCLDCVTTNCSGVCETIQCENCKQMEFCNQCEESFCLECKDVTECDLCKKSFCDNCPLLPSDNLSCDRQCPPIECSCCLVSYCGACRLVKKCSVCFKVTCSECEELTRCYECKTLFCGDCEKDMCQQCICCGDFECKSRLDFSHCDRCDKSYCKGCHSVGHCDRCDRKLCDECHPESMTTCCSKCDDTFCSDCKHDTIFCKNCNGCQECVNGKNEKSCDKCLESHCDNCWPVEECDDCDECETCLKVHCQDCLSDDPMLQCTECMGICCSDCGFIHEIGTNPPHESSDMFLTTLMDTGGGLLAVTEGPLTRSAVKTLRDAHEQKQEVGICANCFHERLGEHNVDAASSVSSTSSVSEGSDDEEDEGEKVGGEPDPISSFSDSSDSDYEEEEEEEEDEEEDDNDDDDDDDDDEKPIYTMMTNCTKQIEDKKKIEDEHEEEEQSLKPLVVVGSSSSSGGGDKGGTFSYLSGALFGGCSSSASASHPQSPPQSKSLGERGRVESPSW